MDPISLLVIAGSAALKYGANRHAEKRRSNIRSAMEAYQRTKARENEAVTQKLIEKQAPAVSGAELAQAASDREKSMRDTVGAAQAFDAPAIGGKVSGDYRAAEEANAGRIAERTRLAIQRLATMAAPGDQQQKFALRFGRAAGEVDAGNRAIDSVGRGYLSDIDGVRPNPWLTMAGDAGMSLGAGMALSGASPGTAVNNGQGFEDASGNLYSDNVTRPARLSRGFSLWGAR